MPQMTPNGSQSPKDMGDRRPLTVSIIIKALNEERYIAAAIESALTAIKGLDAEIILADSASTDRTIEIAKRYPIKIVQMTRGEDQSCGAGAQLGFQYSSGRYIWLVDGDMEMRPAFLAAAIPFLDSHPDVAGVGGMLTEHETSNLEYVKRSVREYGVRRPGLANRLDGGGVYRRAAIESVGYLTDCNMHGCEELELGTRLVSRGWKLARLPVPDVDHHGHSGSAYRLLWRRLTSGVCFANGEVVRAALGRDRFLTVLHRQKRDLILLASICGWWLSLLTAAVVLSGWAAAIALAVLAAFPIAAMAFRFRSVALGLYSVAAWQVFAIGFWPGLLRRRIPPAEWIASRVVQDPLDIHQSHPMAAER
jgi:glycosyltransferase involved in cell wall biosynthesis